MKRYIVVSSAVLAAFTVILVLPLTVGVWLPDVFSRAERTLASVQLPDGAELRVVQYWNRVDFYTTELWHTTPTGHRDVQVLDGDDCKSWSVPISVVPEEQTVAVTLCGGREKTVRWSSTPTA